MYGMSSIPEIVVEIVLVGALKVSVVVVVVVGETGLGAGSITAGAIMTFC